MKLSKPETWDRELSLRGNKASVWEELIGTVILTITPLSTLPHLFLSFWTRGFPWRDTVILLLGSCITENDWTYKACR